MSYRQYPGADGRAVRDLHARRSLNRRLSETVAGCPNLDEGGSGW